MASTQTDSLILSLDIGTSSVRATLFDASARALPDMQARRETDVRTTPDGGVEVDPDALVESICACLDQVMRLAGARGRDVVAVGSATLVGNVLGVGRDGRAVTPLYTWADTRATQEAADLRASLDEVVIHDRTGCMLRSSYLPAQLRWLRRAAPDLVRRVDRWLSIGEYLHLRLFGTSTVSYSVASWSGLLDRRCLDWDGELLAVAGVRAEQLSPLVDRDMPATGLVPAFASRWPALASIPWFPAVGDGAASNVGCGAVTPERMALALGTSGAVRVLVEAEIPAIPPGLWVYRLDRRHSLLGGALSEGGNLYAWLQETLALAPAAEVEAELAGLPADGHGLTILPFLAGERSPGWHGDVRATVSGLSLHTRPVEILRAGLESIGYRFAILAALVRQVVPEATTIIGSGAPLRRSSAWAQIICDILGRSMSLAGDAELATSRGVTLLALHALGVIPHLDALPLAPEGIFTPDAAYHARYREGAERHRQLYGVLIGRT